MKLFFKVSRSCGYALQLVADLDKKTIQKGYCLVAWQDLHELKNKNELYSLYNEFIAAGFKPLED